MRLAAHRSINRLGRLIAPLLLTAALLLGAMGAAQPPPVEITVLMPAPFAEATAPLVAQFNREQRDLRVSVTRGPLDTEAMSDLAISSLLLGEAPYDLLLMDVTWTPKYAAAGWLQPLEPWLGSDALAGMAPGAQLGNHFDGHLWRMPLLADMGLLYWRTDLMDQPPVNLHQLAAMAAEQQHSGSVPWGYVWQGRQYEGLSCVFLEVLRAFGGHWLGEGAVPKADLESPQAVAAAAWLAELVRSGVTPAAVATVAEPEALQIFRSGDAAFMRNWPYAWRELQQPGSAVVDRFAVAPLPAGTQGSWGFALLEGSQHPQEAASVIRWFTGEAVNRELALRYGYTPVWTSLLNDPDLERELPLLPVLRQGLETTALRPLTPVYAQLSDVLQRQLSGLITAATTRRQPGLAAAAMARAQQESDLILRSTGQQA